MDIWTFLFLTENSPYAAALILLLVLGLLELGSTLTGLSLSGVLDDLLPDADLGGPDMTAGQGILGWLNFGRVPFLINLVFFSLGFSFSGYFLQFLFLALRGAVLPLPWSLLGALPLGLLISRFLGRLFSRIMPNVQSDAVDLKSLEGSTARITLGTARRGMPAEAKARDRFGKVHYIRVQPYDAEIAIPAGRQVLLVELLEGVFQVEALDLPATSPGPESDNKSE